LGSAINRSVAIVGRGNNIELRSEAFSLLDLKLQVKNPSKASHLIRGCDIFYSKNVALFYGDEVLIRELLAGVQKKSFLTIVGASGSRKSSVAQALSPC